MQITDAQIHLWTGSAAPPHHRRAPYTVEDALREMDEAGIDRAVNCPAIWDPQANDYAAHAVRVSPDRFATLGWFPLSGADERSVDRLLEQPGMLGLRFVLATPNEAGLLAAGELEWLWTACDERELPMSIMVLPEHLPLVSSIAHRHPRMRVMIDHLAVLPFAQLPTAADHLDALLALARHPNVALKATGVPSMATDDYPFTSTQPLVKRCLDAFGSRRLFWGTDITRMSCTWAECVASFMREMPFLRNGDRELVMGAAVSDWIRWS